MEATTATRSSTTTTTTQENNTSPFTHVAARIVIEQLASLSTHPLVSASAAAYVLGVLYLPRCILSLLLSPVLLCTLLLLTILLYFGTSTPEDHPQTELPELRQPGPKDYQQPRQEQHHVRPFPQTADGRYADFNSPAAVLSSSQKPSFEAENHHFIGWPRWGPLEVIYEEYEGEDEHEGKTHDLPGCYGSAERGRRLGIEELSLRCYSDDSDESSASDFAGGTSPVWDLPEDLFLRWEMEEEGLIEIPLEEDNLIEIDISACR